MALNIHQKLIEVRKSCPFLKKDNHGHQFKYVSSSQTLGSLRDAMDEQGLLLVPSVISHETRDHTTANGKHSYFSILTMEFEWVNAENPEEKIKCSWVGYGLDDAEKGIGKALTYAEKFFMLKFFNIATDKDDPDSNQKNPSSPGDQPTPQQAKKEAEFREQTAKEWKGLVDSACTTPENWDAWMKANWKDINDDCGKDLAESVFRHWEQVGIIIKKAAKL